MSVVPGYVELESECTLSKCEIPAWVGQVVERPFKLCSKKSNPFKDVGNSFKNPFIRPITIERISFWLVKNQNAINTFQLPLTVTMKGQYALILDAHPDSVCFQWRVTRFKSIKVKLTIGSLLYPCNSQPKYQIDHSKCSANCPTTLGQSSSKIERVYDRQP